MYVTRGGCMFKISELRQKEIVSLSQGRRLGFATDVEINLETGNIEALILPSQGKFFGLLPKDNDIVVPWEKIKRVGTDLILIDIE